MKALHATATISLVAIFCSFTFSTSRELIQTATGAIANRKIPAVIAFGDSILDTGNNNNLKTLSKCNFPPYGKNFLVGIATGRWNDGRAFSDLLAGGLGVKDVLPAYLDPQLRDSDLPTGVCFASGGSGLDPSTADVQGVLHIGTQLNYFKQYLKRLSGVVGEEKAKSIISNSLFLISSGNNDVAINFGFHLRMQYDVDLYTTQLVTAASTFVKDIYALGARKIAFMGTLPLGCLPGERTMLGGVTRLCGEIQNQAAQLFNSKLASMLSFLNNTYNNANIFYLDVYNPLYAIIQNPQASGFEVSANGCCGTGTSEMASSCNQLNPYTCPNPSMHVFWDSAHPTEHAYRVVVSQILRKYANDFSWSPSST